MENKAFVFHREDNVDNLIQIWSFRWNNYQLSSNLQANNFSRVFGAVPKITVSFFAENTNTISIENCIFGQI
ncbi:hypothetical protein [Pedobacter alluvionis]|uniref:Uncharacterized protein n=1 Tax=Pedobacter alluvionis TaxID=475253 RepID=A0A497Y5E7_9SPHI|nr:hypothetical protein [Pedobacter alluvionis]RLJ77327.1 hypothetical protein BCL90_2412 [Pedobacter alluvionis]TFB33451.1 hypothetical protein E3V97_05230 [Pedobacter alluvionis]